MTEMVDLWGFAWAESLDGICEQDHQPRKIPASWQPLLAILDSREKDRCLRFRRLMDRLGFLAGHALLRTALSTTLGGTPASWEFQRDRFGKPYIKNPPEDAPLGRAVAQRHSYSFSLTHTKGLAVVAVSQSKFVGVDAEFRHRPCPLELADHVFSAVENQYLQALSEAEQTHEFFRIWTLKEAFMKAHGYGLRLPTEKFSVLDPDCREARLILHDSAAFTHQEESDCDQLSWFLSEINVHPDFQVAFCVGRRATAGSDERITPCVRQVNLFNRLQS